MAIAAARAAGTEPGLQANWHFTFQHGRMRVLPALYRPLVLDGGHKPLCHAAGFRFIQKELPNLFTLLKWLSSNTVRANMLVSRSFMVRNAAGNNTLSLPAPPSK
jgi:hypothetical protein